MLVFLSIVRNTSLCLERPNQRNFNAMFLSKDEPSTMKSNGNYSKGLIQLSAKCVSYKAKLGN